MYLHGFAPSCRRPFAESKESVEDHSCPPDFGPPQADEFFRHLDNKKGFPFPDFNFFTASPPRRERDEVRGSWMAVKKIHAAKIGGTVIIHKG